MIGDGLQAIGKFAELGLKFAVLITALDILPTVVEHDIIVAKVSKTQTQELV